MTVHLKNTLPQSIFQSPAIKKCTQTFALLILIGLCHGSRASDAEGRLTADVIEFGLYKEVGSAEVLPQKSKTTERQTSVDKQRVRFLYETNLIPARKGITFGITYLLKNIGTNNQVSLDVEFSHPQFKKPHDKEGNSQKVRIIHQGKYVAQPRHLTYSLTEDYELVTGQWIASVYHNGDVLVRKVFNVTSDVKGQ